MTDQRKVAGLNAILDKPRPTTELPPASNAPALKSARGYAGTPQAKGGGGGGMGSLAETPNTREYHDAATILPPDGFFFYSVRAVKKLHFTDGSSMELQIPAYGNNP